MRPYRAIPVGKPIKSENFVYGWHCEIAETHFIIPKSAMRTIYKGINPSADRLDFTGFIEVIPETVGQQVGKQDINKKEIYKGDRVKIMTHWDRVDESKSNYWVQTVTNGCSCGLNTNGMVSIQKEGQKEYVAQLEIIGNIHTENNKEENQKE